MKIKSDDNIYNVVEKALAKQDEPVTCATLMDMPEVKKAAIARFGPDVQIATNKLSDLLGFMWRRTVLERYPAPPSRSMARFAYKLAKKEVSTRPPTPISPPTPLFRKQNFEVIQTEEGVVIDFEKFTLTIRSK